MLLLKSVLLIILFIILFYLLYLLYDICKSDNEIKELNEQITEKTIKNLIPYRCDIIGGEACPNHNVTENRAENCSKYYTNGCLFLFNDNKDKCEMSINKCLDCKFSDINDFMSLGAFIYCRINGKRLNVHKCIKEA